MPKVSVIVAVYKMEPYIERCVRSLFCQTLDDMEFIFIDDASPDASISIVKEVLEEFPERKKQVKFVTHTANRGIAAVRQSGVDASEGEYIIHCDADDWVERDMYEVMYRAATETGADISGCDIYREYGDRTEYVKEWFDLPAQELTIELLKGEKMHAYLPIRLIKASFIRQTGIKFDEKLSSLEDMQYLFPLHLKAGKTAYISRALYHYDRSVPTSLTRTKNQSIFDSHVSVYRHLASILPHQTYMPHLKRRFGDLLFFYIMSARQYNPSKWLKEYKPIIEDTELPLSKRERISIWLIERGFWRLNYLILLAGKVGFKR